MASATFQDRSAPGGLVHNPAAPYAREMAKWEMAYSPYGPPGRPRETVGYQAFPACYYLMTRNAQNGGFTVQEMIEAQNENEAANLMSRGFRLGRAAAQAAVEEQEQVLAVGAAERAKGDLRMSEKAKAEAAVADASTLDHLPSVPEKPIRKRAGRPAKVTP